MLIHINESLWETACDNLGFELSSAPLILEIQADMIMSQPAFNLLMEKPLALYDSCLQSAVVARIMKRMVLDTRRLTRIFLPIYATNRMCVF